MNQIFNHALAVHDVAAVLRLNSVGSRPPKWLRAAARRKKARM
jgi:hypothetical protein